MGTIRWVGVCAVLALVGCATEAGYQKILDSWVGAREENLVSKWGPPQGFYEANGTRYLTYDESRNAYVPGVAPTYQTTFIGNTAYTNAVGGSPGFMVNQSCRTTFEVRNSVITSWRYQGNNCVAMP